MNPEMENVLSPEYAGDVADRALVTRAQEGQRDALEALVARHQGWIFNLALRMVGSPEDAQDVTQEILIKLITRLSTFQGRSRFRTWLYAMVVNHVLSMRRRPLERLFCSFEREADLMDGLTLSEPPPGADGPLLEQETRMGCMTGMLLCLDRPQRIAVVLSTLFGADSELGGALLETTAQNYRQILSRARKLLAGFMNDRCGLMNEANPCRCGKKTGAAIRAGLVDPRRLRFTGRHLHRVREFVTARTAALETALEARLGTILREQPLYEPPDFTRLLRVVLARGELGEFVNFT